MKNYFLINTNKLRSIMSKNVAYMKIIIYLSRPVSVVIIDTNPIKSKLSPMEMSSIIAINLAEMSFGQFLAIAGNSSKSDYF